MFRISHVFLISRTSRKSSVAGFRVTARAIREETIFVHAIGGCLALRHTSVKLTTAKLQSVKITRRHMRAVTQVGISRQQKYVLSHHESLQSCLHDETAWSAIAAAQTVVVTAKTARIQMYAFTRAATAECCAGNLLYA